MEGLIIGQTAQISMNRGLEVFGDAGSQAVHKEMKQLHDQKVLIPVKPAKLSCGSIIGGFKYLMFLKMKRDGSIKAAVAPTAGSNVATRINKRADLL